MNQTHQSILKVLKNGKNISPTDLSKKTGVSSLSQRIAELRKNGYPNIYTNTVAGEKFYRLGTPTKAMRKAARNGELTLAK
jgi:biotin operon repressor